MKKATTTTSKNIGEGFYVQTIDDPIVIDKYSLAQALGELWGEYLEYVDKENKKRAKDHDKWCAENKKIALHYDYVPMLIRVEGFLTWLTDEHGKEE